MSTTSKHIEPRSSNMPSVKIKGMKCQHCSGAVSKALAEISGISDIDVDLDKGIATYTGDAPAEIIKEAISKIGFEAE